MKSNFVWHFGCARGGKSHEFVITGIRGCEQQQYHFLLIPTAVIGTWSGLPGALVTIFKVAVSVAAASAWNKTAIVQLLPGPSLPLPLALQ
jgi:hypothetical protein